MKLKQFNRAGSYTALLMIILFMLSSVTAELTGQQAIIAIVKKVIFYSLPVLIVSMAVTVLTTKKLFLLNPENSLYSNNARRIKWAALNGIFFLAPLASILYFKAQRPPLEHVFYQLQFLEFICGSLNIFLLFKFIFCKKDCLGTRLTLREKIAFRFIFNEKRVYHRWYGRFLSFGIDYGRLKRVVARVSNWLEWCREWTKEGDHLYQKAEDAIAVGDRIKAIALYHEAVGCYHAGQHIFFIDGIQKESSQEKARHCYKKAIELYDKKDQPIPISIPFKGVHIPGYLRLSEKNNQPLIIFVNGMDNIKEAEGHAQGTLFKKNGYNHVTFDGPGQGELWRDLKFDGREYRHAVSAVIDWLEQYQSPSINMSKIALVGFSLGGYLAPMCAAWDQRVTCVVGNSGLVYIGGLKGLNRLNPIWQRGVTYMTGCSSLERAVNQFDWDIENEPRLKAPLLFYHAGRDEVMPSPRIHADKMMLWANGDKTLKYYEDAEHCTQDYLDEVFPEIIDWLNKTLN